MRFSSTAWCVVTLILVAVNSTPSLAGDRMSTVDTGADIVLMGANPAGTLVYATLDSNEVIEVGFGGGIMSRAAVPGEPGEFNFSPDGSKLYLCLEDANAIVVYDLPGLGNQTTIDLLDPINSNPAGVVATDTRLYVGYLYRFKIIDLATGEQVFSGQPTGIGSLSSHLAMVMSPDESTVLIAASNSAPSSIYAIRVVDDNPVFVGEDCCHGCRGGIGGGFSNMVFSDDGSIVYYGPSVSDDVRVVNREESGSMNVIGQLLTGEDARGMIMARDGSEIWVANDDMELVAIRMSDMLPYHVSDLPGSHLAPRGFVGDSSDTIAAVGIDRSWDTDLIEFVSLQGLEVNRGGVRMEPRDDVTGLPIDVAYVSGDTSYSSGYLDVQAGVFGHGPIPEGPYDNDLVAGWFVPYPIQTTIVTGQWTDIGVVTMTRYSVPPPPSAVCSSPGATIGATTEIQIHGRSFHPDATLGFNGSGNFVYDSYEWVDWSTINATVTVDSEAEPGPHWKVRVINPDGEYEIGDITLIPPDTMTLEFGIGAVTIDEGAGSVELQVVRSGARSGAVSVDFQTIDGTATGGVDFGAQSGTLTWDSGDDQPKVISVTINQDAVFEGDEGFTVDLSNPTGGAELGDTSVATVIISDDDASVVESEQAAASVDETGGTLSVIVNRTGELGLAASVVCVTSSGSATEGSDFSATSETLDWGVGDGDAKNVVIPILDDALTEGYESFSVSLESPSGNAIIGGRATMTVTIEDDDASVFVVGDAAYSVSETETTLTVDVYRQGVISGDVSVTYTTNDLTATAGFDYSAQTGTLDWFGSDSTPRSIVIGITDDIDDEGSETFLFTLSNPIGGAILGDPNTLTVTILDNDACQIALAAPSHQVSETAEVVGIKVRRDGETTGQVAVSYSTVPGSAGVGFDFVATSGTLTWADGDNAEQTVYVTIVDDSDVEGSESFSLELSGLTGLAILGSPSSSMIVIQDDEWREIRVNTFTTSEQTRPDIAMDDEGNAVVVWDSYAQDSSEWGVFGQRFDSVGAELGTEFPIPSTVTGNQRDARVAMAPDGRFVVVWGSGDGSGNGVFFQRFDSSGNALGSETRANSATSGEQSNADVAIIGGGGFMVVWQGADSSGSGVFGRPYSATGMPLIAETRLNSTTDNDQILPAVAGKGDGFVVVWESVGQDGPASGIAGRLYASSGAPQSGEFIVNSIVSGDQMEPGVSAAPDGSFVVAWHDSTHQDGHGYSIQAQRYLASGVQVGPQFQVNSHYMDDQTSPSVAMNAQGASVFCWESADQDGSGMGSLVR